MGSRASKPEPEPSEGATDTPLARSTSRPGDLLNPLPPCPPGFSEHVYKRAHGVDVPLRIWPAPDAARKGKPAPWVFWVHGGEYPPACELTTGSYIGGKWSIPTVNVSVGFAARGYHVVSVGHRLTPHVGVAEVIEDLADAYVWLRAHLPSILGDAVALDDSIIFGGSAGGTLAFNTASEERVRAHPPRALVFLYGAADLTDKWYHTPQDIPLPPYLLPHAADESDLEAWVMDRDARKAITQNPWEDEVPPKASLESLRRHLGMPGYEVTREVLFRIDAATYLTKLRRITATFLRRERFPDAAEWLAERAKWSPVFIADRLDTFPPTYIMQAEDDEYVPLYEPKKLAAKLRERGWEVVEKYAPSGGHCFDWAFTVSRGGDGDALTTRAPSRRGGRSTSTRCWISWIARLGGGGDRGGGGLGVQGGAGINCMHEEMGGGEASPSWCDCEGRHPAS
ncbi:hypothetical protein Q8F55_004905 [Vanrija albida]|uniref:Alpha/beta hydrolase fold-3 domain-containing protein n=1 Tax=Vanrija albida TaxID=181172 RepID=A0ABR3Q0H0_9TREE